MRLDRYLKTNLSRLIEEYLDALRATTPGDHGPKQRLVSRLSRRHPTLVLEALDHLQEKIQRGDYLPDWPLAFHSAIEMLRLEFSR